MMSDRGFLRDGIGSGAWAVGVAMAGLWLLAAGGCASSGSSGYNVEQGEIARRALPMTSELSHHADSLGHLRIEEKEGRLAFILDGSYRQRLLEWTSARSGTVQRSYFRTHATLWSRELSLASLIPERGVNTLSESLARKMIAEREAEYDSLLQIDVYVFARSIQSSRLSNMRIDRPGMDVELSVRSDNDEDYQVEPLRMETGVPRQSYHAGRNTIYLRTVLFFDRDGRDGRDLLDAEELRLRIRAGYFFTWTFPEVGAAFSGP